MTFAVWITRRLLGDVIGDSWTGALVLLVALVLAGAAVFAGAAALLRMPELRWAVSGRG
jgi:hypothetical protein